MAKKQLEDESRSPSTIPEFATVQEESLFWDTHDITEFLDETTPLTINFLGSIGEAFSVPLDTRELVELMRLATAKGISVTDLVHSWIKEHLAIEPE